VTVHATNFAGQATQMYNITVRQGAPTAPTNLTVTAASGTSIGLSWTASFDAAGVAGYRVYRVSTYGHSGRGGGTTTVYTLVAGNITGTATTISGLTPGASLRLVVAAYDSANLQSPYSGSVVATAQNVPVLSSSRGTSITTGVQQQLAFTLSALGYPTNFHYSVVNGPSGMLANATTGVVTWTPPIAYWGSNSIYTFQATNSAGTGSLAISIYVGAAVYTLPAPIFTSASLSGGVVSATPGQQTALQLLDSNKTKVTWSLIGGPAGLTFNATTGAVTWLPPATLLPGSYSATFQATNTGGSATLTVPLMLDFASAPATFQVSNLQPAAHTADLTWLAPALHSHPVSRFLITVSYTSSTGATQTVTYLVSNTATKYTLTGLPTGTQIAVSIAALDLLGDQSERSSLSFVL
jgi:hypothetical protein